MLDLIAVSPSGDTLAMRDLEISTQISRTMNPQFDSSQIFEISRD